VSNADAESQWPDCKEVRAWVGWVKRLWREGNTYMGAWACDHEGNGSRPSVDHDSAGKRAKFQVRGRKVNTYMLMNHFIGSGDVGATALQLSPVLL